MSCIRDEFREHMSRAEIDMAHLGQADRQITSTRNWTRSLLSKGKTNKVEAIILDYIAAKSATGEMVMQSDGKTVIKEPMLVKKNGNSLTVTMSDGTKATWMNGRADSVYKDAVSYNSEIMKDIEHNATLGSDNTDEWIFDEKLNKSRRKTAKEKLEGYELISSNDLINEPEAIKDLIDVLVDKEQTAVSDAEVDMLKEVVDMIADPIAKYGREMNVNIKREADKNGGFINFGGENKGIYLSVNTRTRPLGNEMSVAQRYVHELVHGVTHFAYNYGSAKLTGTVTRLKQLHEQVMSEVDWKVFMPEVSVDYEAEKAIAQARWEYLNSSENAIEEFIAYAMTHKPLRDVMDNMVVSRTDKSMKDMNMWQQFKEYVNRMISWAFEKARNEPQGTKASAVMQKLTKDLMEANDLAVKNYNKGVVRDSLDMLDSAEAKWVEWVDGMGDWVKGDKEWLENIRKDMPGKDQSIKGAIWMLKNGWRMWSNKDFRPYMSTMLDAFFMPKLGTFQTALRHLTDTDKFQDKLEELGLARNKIEQSRMRIRENTRKMFNKLWGRKFTAAEQKAITVGVLKTDIGALVDDYSAEEIKDFIKYDDELDAEIERLFEKLSPDDIKTKRYKTAQIKGLAGFMLTGKGSDIQQMNAYMIHNMVGTKYEYRTKVPNSNGEKLVDKLTTLYAMKIQSKDVKEELLKLADENIEGLLAYGNHTNYFAEEQYSNPTSKIKGWVKEEYNSDITSKIVPLSMQDEMEEQGYELVEEVLGYNGTSASKTFGLFVNKDRLMTNYNVSAMGLTDSVRHQAASLYDNSFHKSGKLDKEAADRQIKAMKARGDKRLEEIREGRRDSTFDPVNLLPLRNKQGQIVNYVQALSQVQKQEHLEMDMDPNEIIGAMQASIHDQRETDRLNDKLVNELVYEMDKDFDGDEELYGVEGTTYERNDLNPEEEYGESGHKYVLISGDNEHAKVKEIWRVMPTKMKERIKGINSSGKGLWVREEALHDAFGFRAGSLMDLETLSILPNVIKHAIKTAEKLWQDIVKVAKVDIIMRVPAVLIGNIISNTIYLLQMGFNPRKVVAMQANGLAELNRFVETSSQIEEMKAKKIAKGLSKSEQQKLDRLEATVKDGSIGDLVDAGLYQSIIEDVKSEDVKSSSRIHKKANEVMEDMGAPSWVKTGANWAYVSERTGLFQFMQKATQYSDFLARYTMYHLGLERQIRSFKKKYKRDMTSAEMAKAKKELIKEVTQSFINYNKPDSVFLQWMNDMGLVMFTKYVVRIQKVWKDGVAKHPIRFLLAAMGQEMAGLDIDDISDQAIVNKGVSSFFYSPDMGGLMYRAVVPVALRLDSNV